MNYKNKRISKEDKLNAKQTLIIFINFYFDSKLMSNLQNFIADNQFYFITFVFKNICARNLSFF